MWTVTLGAGKGVAVKVKFGVNEGKFELQWKIGFGVGASAHIDFSDETQVTHTGIGVGVEGSVEIDAGIAGSVEVSADIACEYAPDIGQNIFTNEAEISVSGPNLERASISVADGEVEFSNPVPELEFGFDTMIIAGFSGQDSMELKD